MRAGLTSALGDFCYGRQSSAEFFAGTNTRYFDLSGALLFSLLGNWSYGLMRDIGAILPDMGPDQGKAEILRHAIEDSGDKVVDLHVWRVGPGHMSAVVSVAARDSLFYHANHRVTAREAQQGSF